MIQCARNIQIVKKEESMITRAIIIQLEKEEERERVKEIVCVVKDDMMAFMPYENDVHIKHLLLCLQFLMLKTF
jgi:hypothetical protein